MPHVGAVILAGVALVCGAGGEIVRGHACCSVVRESRVPHGAIPPALDEGVLSTRPASAARGPVFFRHTRVGRDGRPIRVTKYRTMVPDAVDVLERDPELRRRYVQNGFKLSPHEDPRITPVGRVLRRLSLDELPQLWDVLLG